MQVNNLKLIGSMSFVGTVPMDGLPVKNAYHHTQICDTIAVWYSETFSKTTVKTLESYSRSKDESLGLVSSFKVIISPGPA